MEKNITKNPLLEKSTLPYGAPDFSKIKDEHYKEALEEGMRLQKEYVQKIIENKEIPTFENTIIALERSGKELRSVSNIFFGITSANTNETLKGIQKEISPKLAAHRDVIFLNEELFQKVKTIYEQRKELQLDSESNRLIEYYYDSFILSGANLSKEQKEELKQINEELASLTNDFNQNTLENCKENALIITNEEELEGLTKEEKELLLQKDGSWRIPLLNTTQQPLFISLKNRKTREKLFEKSWNRAVSGQYSTTNIITSIAKLRAKKANLLGYNNYAEWSLQKTMAKTTEVVFKFMEELLPIATKKVKKEAEEIKKIILSEGEEVPQKIAPYDWDYYAEKVRKQKYDLDESQIKPYFELFNVLENGVFYAATKLYGITFRKREDIPVYHPDVVVYELLEESGEALGLFYGDFFARETKKGGAWMSSFVTQTKLLGQKPVIYNVCNYTKPIGNAPALLSYSEVETLFHEFGHALHGFFANQEYPSLSGTAVARDFVEFPSQFNENWTLYPEILKNYAFHYQTKEIIPEKLLEKIKNASIFNQGYAFTEVLAAAYLDMKWHTLSTAENIENIDQFEQETLKDFPLEVPPRYRSTYFSHIFGGGYGAGYYSYQYSEMLDHDAFNWIEENGGITRENGQRLRELILSKGNTEDYQQMYEKFRGGMPTITPLLKARGLE
ncbi:MAG: M3 family metallopeptidase [Capnocytophaga sp.]|nr:M3 family metallopeptidase [Capnocytophaga sp.]